MNSKLSKRNELHYNLLSKNTTSTMTVITLTLTIVALSAIIPTIRGVSISSSPSPANQEQIDEQKDVPNYFRMNSILVYEHEQVELTCNISNLLLHYPTIKIQAIKNQKIAWFKNEKPFHRDNGENFTYEDNKLKLILNNVGQSDSAEYKCSVDINQPPYNIFYLVNLEVDKHPIIHPPYITDPPYNQSVKIGQSVTFKCNYVSPHIASHLYWFKSPENGDLEEFWIEYNKTLVRGANMQKFAIAHSIGLSELVITNVTQNSIGYYGCHVINGQGEDIRISKLELLPEIQPQAINLSETQQQHRSSGELQQIAMPTIGFALFVVIVVALILLLRVHGYVKHGITLQSKEAIKCHDLRTTATPSTVPIYDHPPSTGGGFQPSIIINPFYEQTEKFWNFPRERLEFRNILGKGDFGEVWLCSASDSNGNSRAVAVKMLIDPQGIKQRHDFLAEIEIMKTLAGFPNVVNMLGCCTEDNQAMYLIMEFVEKGELISHLRKNRVTCPHPSPFGQLTSRDLIQFCHDIANGMHYISSQGIIHRDLAARNILLSASNTCKVADFGFARKVDHESPYEKKSDDKVPVRWMAPESFDKIYTTKSDVYSFGILMWEIVTLGSTPYPELSAKDVMQEVQQGKRLQRPEHCHADLYKIMLECWSHAPNDRPKFSDLVMKLHELSVSDDQYIELDRCTYYNILTDLTGEKL